MNKNSHATQPHTMPGQALPRAAPSERDVDPDAISAWLDSIEAAGLELHAMMLWRKDAVVAEGWRWPYQPRSRRMTHSVTKSVTACAIGLLLDEGRLSLDDRIAGFFPEAMPGASERAAQITVRHLLEMRAGHGSEVSGSVWRGIDTSWTDEFFRIPVIDDPGTTYVYSSAASYMLSAIVTKVTGETLHDYLRPRLFMPLGIHGEQWDLGPDGINPGGNGLSLTTEDMLRLGILHLQNGQWNGRAILPASWVAAATRPQGAPTYGYHWVVGDDYYAALGVFVQAVLVFPGQESVLVIQGAMENSAAILPYIRQYFPHGFVAGGRASGDAGLRARLLAWKERPPISGCEEAGRAVAGTRWRVHANALGVCEIAFDGSPGMIGFTLVDAMGWYSVQCGLTEWIGGVSMMPGASLHHGYPLRGTPIVAGARWVAADHLELIWNFPETAFRDRVSIRFAGDRLTLDREVNMNSGSRRWPTLQADLMPALEGPAGA
ncbi:serine hydrolase domain-containing protein [Gluconacetobacter sp. Hr-1-5]|uniref:serine hydrolase domain-containing protein n=1 Tax=Gluconacetobacter sp. Hr-1-5 TaxID=3395370 RepID=UPI003B517B7D